MSLLALLILFVLQINAFFHKKACKASGGVFGGRICPSSSVLKMGSELIYLGDSHSLLGTSFILIINRGSDLAVFTARIAVLNGTSNHKAFDVAQGCPAGAFLYHSKDIKINQN